MEETAFERFSERYVSGEIPWDAALPPPEVIELAENLGPERALDLGSGYGRTALYLAQNGWQVDGVDFIPQAIAEATSRAAQAGLSERTQFYEASVSDLGFLHGRYQLAVDVGCFHALDESQQRAYAAELTRLLAPGAPFLLFVRIKEEAQDEDGPPALLESVLTTIFTHFTLEKSEIGTTEVNDKIWKSGWFWFIHQG